MMIVGSGLSALSFGENNSAARREPSLMMVTWRNAISAGGSKAGLLGCDQAARAARSSARTPQELLRIFTTKLLSLAGIAWFEPSTRRRLFLGNRHAAADNRSPLVSYGNEPRGRISAWSVRNDDIALDRRWHGLPGALVDRAVIACAIYGSLA